VFQWEAPPFFAMKNSTLTPCPTWYPRAESRRPAPPSTNAKLARPYSGPCQVAELLIFCGVVGRAVDDTVAVQ
jgi:hypothetical protein